MFYHRTNRGESELLHLYCITVCLCWKCQTFALNLKRIYYLLLYYITLCSILANWDILLLLLFSYFQNKKSIFPTFLFLFCNAQIDHVGEIIHGKPRKHALYRKKITLFKKSTCDKNQLSAFWKVFIKSSFLNILEGMEHFPGANWIIFQNNATLWCKIVCL